ncbi:hypothetical protein PoB_006831500 [Plakobranchus ocellatus]|uniref:Uncharacterized protein n=1 Tax=Plakobranchus ocellatus TaxID=259542 RepID=A0AAV4DCP0_9GAST|nr:hypothetical protein PoB_006831500 [Plakobranchus ocellatus]
MQTTHINSTREVSRTQSKVTEEEMTWGSVLNKTDLLSKTLRRRSGIQSEIRNRFCPGQLADFEVQEWLAGVDEERT